MIQKKLFWKILKTSISMLISIVIFLCVLIYLLMPPFYRNLQRNKVENIFTQNELVLSLIDETMLEIQTILNLLGPTQSSFTIFDDQMDVVFEHNALLLNMSIFTGNPISEQRDFELRQQLTYQQEYLQINPTIVYLNYQTLQANRTLQVRIPSQPLDDARGVILSIFPLATGIALILAFFISVLYSKWIVNPIKKIQIITTSMANFEPVNLISTGRNDEIEELSKGINYLYEQLTNSIYRLEKEIKNVRNVENKKIEFLQTVSHEMKTPLASVNSLIEGIRYKIPPYNDNQDHYLEQCQIFLAKAINLTKETLKLAELGKKTSEIINVVEIVNQYLLTYNVISLSKKITIKNEVNMEKILIQTNLNLFEKVLSNLISNAIYHNFAGGVVSLNYEHDRLVIFNTSKMILTEVDDYFKPLTSNENETSTGLGLYIVKQILEVLNLPFTFNPSEDFSGMEFTLDLRTVIIEDEREV